MESVFDGGAGKTARYYADNKNRMLEGMEGRWTLLRGSGFVGVQNEDPLGKSVVGNPLNAVDPNGLTLVAVGDEKERGAVLSAFQGALREAGAEDVADQLVLEESERRFVTTAGDANLSESENSTVALIGSAMRTPEDINVALASSGLKKFGGALTNATGTRSDPSAIRILLNDSTIASLVIPGRIDTAGRAGESVGMMTSLATALVHELGHAYGYFAEGALRFPVFGQTNATAVRFENEHGRLLADSIGRPFARRLRH